MSRNASSMDSFSMNGVIDSTTSNTSFDMREYSRMSGGTNRAFGARLRASTIGIADRTPKDRAS